MLNIAYTVKITNTFVPESSHIARDSHLQGSTAGIDSQVSGGGMFCGAVPRFRCEAEEHMISFFCAVPFPAREGRKLSGQPKFGGDRVG